MSDIIDGLGSLLGGLRDIGKGALQLLWGAFKLALSAVVSFIEGLYEIVKGIFLYVKQAYKKIKRERPKAKPLGGGDITGKALINAIKNAEREIGDEIDFNELDKEEAKKALDQVIKDVNEGKIDGMHYIDGKNEQGEDDVLDAQFFRSEQMSDSSKNKNIYRPFVNVH